MNRSFHRCLAIVTFLAPLALSSPAAAQDDADAAAEALFNQGVAKMEARQFRVGCAEIAESQRLDPRPGTLYTLAQCEVRWGRTATAAARLGEYLEVYEHLSPEKKEKQRERPKVARTQLEQLSSEMPALTLTLRRGAPAGTVVKCDDAVVAIAALGHSFPVDPGEHIITTQAPGGPVREQRIIIAKSENKPLVLNVNEAIRNVSEVPVAQSIVETEDEPGPSKRRVAAYVVGGAGIAGLVVGGVMGGLALGKKSIIDANCGVGKNPKDPTDALFCKPDGLTAANDVKPLGLVSTVGFAVGLAGVGTAIVMILTEPKKATPATGARRSWISASVLSVGPGGAVVGAQGAW